jgi:hypothetical protein
VHALASSACCLANVDQLRVVVPALASTAGTLLVHMCAHCQPRTHAPTAVDRLQPERRCGCTHHIFLTPSVCSSAKHRARSLVMVRQNCYDSMCQVTKIYAVHHRDLRRPPRHPYRFGKHVVTTLSRYKLKSPTFALDCNWQASKRAGDPMQREAPTGKVRGSRVRLCIQSAARR